MARERSARQRRSANARPVVLPVTQASGVLAAALEEAGLGELAVRARRLEFDENYSSGLGLHDLVVALTRVGAPGLIDRVLAGDFDATAADDAAYAATPAGRAQRAQFEEFRAANPELEDRAREVFGRLAADPKAQQRLMREHVAGLNEQIHGGGLVEEGLVDGDGVGGLEDGPVDAAVVPQALRGFIGQTGPDGQRLDTAPIIAAAELCGRTGGRQFELGWQRDGVPAEQRGWYAQAQYQGVRLGVQDQPGPEAAAAAFAARLLDGGQCQHCRRLVTTDPRGGWAADRTLLDGRQWSQQEQAEAGVCVWRRVGPTWVRGCEQPGG